LELIKRDTLNVDEIDLLKALIIWAKKEIKDNKLEQKAEVMKLVLKDLLPQVRFIFMTTEQVAAVVGPSGLLEPTETLELFTYLAQRDGKRSDDEKAKLKPGAALARFVARPRKGRQTPKELASLTYQSWAQNGYFFEIRAKKTLVITGLSVMTRNSGDHPISVWWRNGPATDSTSAGWNTTDKMQNCMTTYPEGGQAKLPVEFKIQMKKGDVVAIYFHTTDSNRGGLVSCGSHDASGIGAVTSSDEYLDLVAGASHTTQWGGERSYATGFLGTVHYGGFN